jgi:hypothetical protein
MDSRERHIISLYTGDHFYDNLNRFLSKRDTVASYQATSMENYYKYFYHYLTGSLSRRINLSDPRNDAFMIMLEFYWDDLEWFQKMYYEFTMELYRIIKRCPLREHYITVYRGVTQHYLKEEHSKAYHITTFLSTAIDRVPDAFRTNITYVFTLLPDLPSFYIGAYSGDRAISPYNENELLISPYVFYAFIKKVNREGGHTEYHYVLFPSPVEPPGEFEPFMAFRDTIMDAGPVRGGSEMGIEPLRNGNRRNGTKNGNTRRMNRKNGNRKRVNTKNGNTRRVNTRRVNTKSVNTNKNRRVNHVRERMTSFIGTSSVGVPLTQEMKEMVQAVREGLERGE